MRKLTFPLNKGCGIVPFSYLRDCLNPLVCLFVYLFICFDWFLCLSSQKHPIFPVCQKALQNVFRRTAPANRITVAVFFHTGCHGEGIPHLNNLTTSSSFSSWQLYHSSLAGLSSRGVMVGRPSPVALWDAVRLATVCRRTRTSKQSLSRLLHSLQAAEELREVRCWHGGWVLFRVPLERLSTFKSHRTSQHSASGSAPDG